MTTANWDPDQAVTPGPLDEDLEGRPSVDRYGVLGIEELRGEPLDVALAQEEPDVGPGAEDEQWTQVDAGYHPAPFDPQDPPAPEQQALHVEES